MPRLARIVGIGLPHHITQRGNYRQSIFNSDDDRDAYLRWISEYSDKHGLLVLAYCLMNNHVHFIAVPEQEDSMARVFNSAHMRYSQYFNGKHKISGHLWQGRFFSCVLDSRRLLAAARYVERNPVRAGLIRSPEKWNWSSAAVHCLGENGSCGFALDSLWEYTGTNKSEWKSFLMEADKASELSDIRSYTHSGRPLGNEPFIDKLERKFGRRLRALSVGRPRRKK